MAFVNNPYHPAVATTHDLIRTLLSLDTNHPDRAISKLAKAIHPEHTAGVHKGVIVRDDRFDPEEPWRGSSRAKFNGGVVTVENHAFTDFIFKGPWFEVLVIQRDFDFGSRPFKGPYGDDVWCFDIDLIRGRDGSRYVDWAKRTGTILKMFGDH